MRLLYLAISLSFIDCINIRVLRSLLKSFIKTDLVIGLLGNAFKLAEEAFSYLDHVVVTDKRDNLTNISYAVLPAVAFEDTEKIHFFNSKVYHISIPFCFLASLVSGFFISMALWRKLRIERLLIPSASSWSVTFSITASSPSAFR